MVSPNEITFVSAFYPLKRQQQSVILKTEEYMSLFKKLVDTGIKLVFFHDNDPVVEASLEELKSAPNLNCVRLPFTNLNTYVAVDNAQSEKVITLPSKRNHGKDTRDYLIVQNAKSEFIKIASNILQSKFYAWIDAGIFKIIKDSDNLTTSLQNIPDIPEDKITIPGCWEKGVNLNQINDQINWRFCGGYIIVPSVLVNTFNSLCEKQLKLTLDIGCLTWETNSFASIEVENPELFNWYQADHNISMFQIPLNKTVASEHEDLMSMKPAKPASGEKKKRVILLTMVKNEQRIIERLIRSVLNICDAICVCDTGSTDSTRSIVEKLHKTLDVPVRLFLDEWKNFGHNRSLSFTNGKQFCQELGWDPADTYGLLLDGDMVLKVSSSFNKQSLTDGGYLMIQSSGSLDYHNTRFVRFADNWRCVGVTHEYWDGPGRGELKKEDIYIDDIGDGGCKADKFERDIRLLTEGLEKEPNNERYYFYLAQSYKDSGKKELSIKTYKKRIAIGGWDEEIWYSHYMIARLYLEMGKIHKAEKWVDKAYALRKSRAEPLYMLVRHFRNVGDQYKAMHYWRLAKQIPYPKDLLFIEKNIYEYELDYEYTILHFYVSPNNNFYGTKFCLQYMNKHRHNWDNVFSNIQYYAPRLCDNFTPRKIEATCPDPDFHSSSVSLIKYQHQPGGKEQLLANIRFVNYKIRPDGGYDMKENGVWNSGYWVRTKNAYQLFDLTSLEPIAPLVMMDGYLKDVQQFHATNIRGLEDIRLFRGTNGSLKYSATTREWSYDGHNRIVCGNYDIDTQTFKSNKCLKPPRITDCEKNWICHSSQKQTLSAEDSLHGHGDDIIYNWSPLEVGKTDSEGQLTIHTTHKTPIFFERVRGSSSLIEYEGKLWAVTHSVVYSTPRKYYHNLVVLEKDTYRPLQMSIPFCFIDSKIEYCLGFVEHEDNFIFTFSFNDDNSQFVRVPVEWFKRNMMVDI